MKRQVFDYQCQIHVVDENDKIIDTIAEIDGFSAAKAALDAFGQSKTYSRIQLRECSRIVETLVTGAYDHVTKTIELKQRIR